MSPEPIYMRFENVSSPHRRFYEVKVDLSLFYPKRLVRRWGPIGSRRPRAIRMAMAEPRNLTHQVEAITRLRKRTGYQTMAEVQTLAIGAPAA